MSTSRPYVPRTRPLVRPRMPQFGTDDRLIDTSLIVFDTSDRHSWDAMLFQPRDGAVDPRAAALVVHGSVGNYLSGIPRRLAFGLARRGVTVMTANTRMANFGAFFGTGLLDRVPLDLDAAIKALRRRGFRRVVLVGYSMGSTMVSHYQAVHEPPEVVGVCTLAHPLSLPLSLRRRWERFGSIPSYNEMSDIVRRGMRSMDDPSSDRIIIVRRASGPTDRPEHAEVWTYRTWWHSRGPEALQAESRRWVGLLQVPLAMIQAGDDMLITREEGVELMRIARDGGCPEVHLEYIGDADHVFRGYEADAVDAAQTWIADLLERVRPAGSDAPVPLPGSGDPAPPPGAAEVSPRG